MKSYENTYKYFLPLRMPMIIRLDGKNFSNYTKKFTKPYDERIKLALSAGAEALLKEISDSQIAYLQSDECSVLVTDYKNFDTQPYLKKNIQKICSISSSIMTLHFSKKIRELTFNSSHEYDTALFHSKCFSLTKEEVNNYFVSRQNNAIRNSVLSLGQKYFSHQQMHNKNVEMVKENLKSVYNVDWNDLPLYQKRGWTLFKEKVEIEKQTRTICVTDNTIPSFKKVYSYIENFL